MFKLKSERESESQLLILGVLHSFCALLLPSTRELIEAASVDWKVYIELKLLDSFLIISF